MLAAALVSVPAAASFALLAAALVSVASAAAFASLAAARASAPIASAVLALVPAPSAIAGLVPVTSSSVRAAGEGDAPAQNTPSTQCTRVDLAVRSGQPAHDHGGVRASSEFEVEQRVRRSPRLHLTLRGTHTQVLGPQPQCARLTLEAHARQVEPELIGHHALTREHVLEQRACVPLRDVVEARPGQRKGLLRRRVRDGAGREDQRAVDPPGGEGAVLPAALVHQARHGAVPEGRLERVEVDQADAPRDVPEGTGEIFGAALEVHEERVVGTEAPGDVPALRPITPGVVESALESLHARIVVGRSRGEQRAQRLLGTTEHQLLRDPALAVPQIAETLLVEVVGEAEPRHGGHLVVQVFDLGASQVPHADAESVAQAVLRPESLGGEAHRSHRELGSLDLHAAPPAHAHVLARDALPVLETGQAHILSLDPASLGQQRGSLQGGQLALGDEVDAVFPAATQKLGMQELAYPKVAR